MDLRPNRRTTAIFIVLVGINLFLAFLGIIFDSWALLSISLVQAGWLVLVLQAFGVEIAVSFLVLLSYYVGLVLVLFIYYFIARTIDRIL